MKVEALIRTLKNLLQVLYPADHDVDYRFNAKLVYFLKKINT